MKTYDAVIVGAGPAGITAALYLARAGCSVLLFEQLTPGGQLLLTEGLENYPGFPSPIKGYELADLFAAHLADHDIARPMQEVASITGKAGAFKISVKDSTDSYSAKVALICSGAKHRHLGLLREESLIGHGVSYCALCDGNFFRDQVVAVVGGGNSAMEEALYLAKLSAKVHLIHRRNEFRGLKIYEDRLCAMPEKVQIHRNTIIKELVGEKDLEALMLENLQNGQIENLPVQGLFIYVGFAPNTGFLPAELARDSQGFIVTDTEMRSNIPGIFAAGDIRSKLCRQVITAAGDGATAAQTAFIFLEQIDA